MLLTSFDPFTAEFDRMAKRAFGYPVQPGMRMDAIRQDGAVELRFDLPGIDPESISVTVDHGVLNVAAKRSEEFSEGEKPFIRERVMGSFRRQLRLSDAVDAEKIEASYDRGILTVRVPVAERPAARKIEIKTEAKAELTA
jgi:HSP20 family protein